MIHVYKDYYIKADEQSYQLGRIVTTKKGDETFQNVTYHTTIKQACNYMLQRLQRDFVNENDLELKGAIFELNKIKENVELEIRDEME